MIIDIWGVKTTRKGSIRKKLHCFLADKDKILNNKKTGYIVRYTCDCEDCKDPEKIYTTTTSTLKRNGWNSFESQVCRSCRSKKSERIKNTVISYKTIEQSVKSESYVLLTKEKEYNSCVYPSQYKLKVICKNGHKRHITWNNWSKGRRCRKCYEEEIFKTSLKHTKGFELYKRLVLIETNDSYKKFKNVVNPYNIKRNRYYHLDHKYSIAQGFRNNILPVIVGSYYNLEIISSKANCSKQQNCSITKEELFNEYFGKTK